MIDRYLEALEQYEMEIISVRKGRGAWICETDQGLAFYAGNTGGL